MAENMLKVRSSKTHLKLQAMRKTKPVETLKQELKEISKFDHFNKLGKHHQLLSLQKVTLVSNPTSEPTLTVPHSV